MEKRKIADEGICSQGEKEIGRLVALGNYDFAVDAGGTRLEPGGDFWALLVDCLETASRLQPKNKKLEKAYKSMLCEHSKEVTREEAANDIAEHHRVLYDAFKKQGFSDDESLKLCITHVTHDDVVPGRFPGDKRNGGI